MATSHVSRFILMHVIRGVKNCADLSCSRTNRKSSSFATKHFQRKSLKLFDLHPPLRRLVLFVAQRKSKMLSNRHTHTHTHTDTQTKYCNHPCACAPRLINHYHEIAIPNTQSPQHSWWNLVLPALHPAQWVTSIFVFSQEDMAHWLFMLTYTWTINEPHLPPKGRPTCTCRCYTKSTIAQHVHVKSA